MRSCCTNSFLTLFLPVLRHTLKYPIHIFFTLLLCLFQHPKFSLPYNGGDRNMLLRTAIFASSDKHLFLTIDHILFKHFEISLPTFPSLANILSSIQVHLFALIFQYSHTAYNCSCYLPIKHNSFDC